MLGRAITYPPEDCGGPIGCEEPIGYLATSDEQVAELDEAERPEVEWLRERHRGWSPDAFDLASARVRFDS